MLTAKASVYLEKRRRDELAELAEFVADDHCAGIRILPADIARAKNITMSFAAYRDSFDGLLEHRLGRFHIYCNLSRVGTKDSGRAHFTLAHELAHYFIDEHRRALVSGNAPAHGSTCEYESKLLVEQEADCFAANLLMPSIRFRQAAQRCRPGLAAAIDLGKQFGTSVTSAAVRYADLGIRPSAVLKWTPKGALDWKWLSFETRAAGLRTTINTNDKIIPGSATAKAFANEPPPASSYFQLGSTATAWFPFVKPFQDAIMIEQAMSLGRFGILTFLYPESGSFPWATE